MCSWTKTDLESIVNEILDLLYVRNEIKPVFTDLIEYEVQYNETHYHFSQRLAKQYNEWFFYNGIQVVFGKPERGEPIEIEYGTELFQYTKINTEGTVLRGDYYTDNPNATATELGISDQYSVRDPNNGWGQTDQVKTVNQESITIENNVEGLKSTSAEINDTWSLKDEAIPTEGGGSQIYIPKNQ
ncbi:MAG: hypothetical protein JKY08_10855 [Flavobacteriaceae bacterium]|nr:hypothetical protein [Flavobacteriaceae bacterium]